MYSTTGTAHRRRFSTRRWPTSSTDSAARTRAKDSPATGRSGRLDSRANSSAPNLAVVTELDHPVFDADNHYYEAEDAFTRHLDPADGPRCVQWAEIDGRKYHVVGGRVSRAVANATFNPISKAGAMHDYFRGNPEGRNPLEFLRECEPIR